MYDNGSIYRSNVRTYKLVLKSAKNSFVIFMHNIPYQ